MNFNNDNEIWNWQDQYTCIEENSSIELPKCLLNGVSQNEQSLSYMLSDEATPLKACGDLAYQVADCEVTGKELEQCNEPSSQAKRRRMLQFKSEGLEAPFYSEAFLRSKETHDSLEDAMSEMSDWVAGFAECASVSGSECLDPSSEGWIADCFNDVNMNFNIEDINASGTSDIQIDIRDIFNSSPEYDANAVKNHTVHPRGNVVFRGRKSYMRTPPKLASSVVKPFAFIKPCGVHGDITLKDINQKIHPPQKLQQSNEDLSDSCLTSAFSGKPVVGRTKIHTEGGKGSITIMRTKG
ncbi:protein XRI1-like isoform X1 [Primulina huaijiensis]|uniref:protein XRI1-like isoform X1 n=1 Tax=Primulina huaijiensis TaxID=1492673 RepID=UPI003CC76E8D